MDPSSSSLFSTSFKRKRDPNSFDDEPNSCKRLKYDVFINYLYEDIGKTFISHLRGALIRNSFTISDHTMLPIGQDMHLELSKAVEESEIYVLVFSPSYASSRRCLDELVDIMDRFCKFDERKVLPVFFKVDPSHVGSQQGLFMEAFKAHKTNFDLERVQEWRQALKDAGQLSGLTLQNGDEAKFVLEIVEELEKMQRPQKLHITDHPVAIGSRAEELISTLRLDLKDHVLVVAVFGISGIGKTTIVKEAYNRIAPSFDLTCFLGDIHYISNWKVELPKALISCLTRESMFSVGNHNEGVTKIIRLIRGQKVLLVLDDVENYQQLEALVIDPKWFYNGSRIIVTTRDKRSLGNIPYTSYHTTLLNRRESFNLFTQLMFGKEDPMNTKFIEDLVCHAGGIPLVLKVWSHHFRHYEKEQWPSLLETLKRIPHGDVQKQLQMSYDSLANRAKKLFLDIVCFFDGMEKDLVVKVLQDEDSAFFPNNEIQNLFDKSLVEIRPYPKLSMHHAIREMGQEIVRQESEDEPGQRTRLWDERDVMRILTECSGTKSIESISLESFGKEEKVVVQVKAFRKMRNLRLIKLYDEYLSWSNSPHDEMTPFSFKKLKYMEWHGFPFRCINVDMGNVVVLRLRYSKLEILRDEIKSLKKLRILDVSFSSLLTKTGSFHGLENLEEMYFYGCENLKELHGSIGFLHKLTILDLRACIPLEKLPWEMIGKLRSLRELNLGKIPIPSLVLEELSDPFLYFLKDCPITKLKLLGCNISKISCEVRSLSWLKHLYIEASTTPLPDNLLQLHELKRIEFEHDNIQTIPNLPQNIAYIKAYDCKSLVNLPLNIPELKSLTALEFRTCPELGYKDPQFLMKVTKLTNLRHLYMRMCSISQVPSEIGNLVSLMELDLSGNKFTSLPDSLSKLSQLIGLKINDCSQLQSIPLLPWNLTNVEAYRCRLLDMKSSSASIQRTCIFRTKVSKESPFNKPLVIALSRECVPNWCNHQNRGDMLSFVAPVHSKKNICGVILYATAGKFVAPTVASKMLNKTKNTSHRLTEMVFQQGSMCVMFYPLDEKTLVVGAGDIVVLKFPQESVSSCGLRLIYDSDVVIRNRSKSWRNLL